MVLQCVTVIHVLPESEDGLFSWSICAVFRHSVSISLTPPHTDRDYKHPWPDRYYLSTLRPPDSVIATCPRSHPARPTTNNARSRRSTPRLQGILVDRTRHVCHHVWIPRRPDETRRRASGTTGIIDRGCSEEEIEASGTRTRRWLQEILGFTACHLL